MKIAILTLPLHTNYGGILQAYALQTVLQRMGHEVTLIDKSRTIPFYRFPYDICRRMFSKYIKKHVVVFGESKQRLYYSDITPFFKRNFNFFHVADLDEIYKKKFDVYIVGSDQIWRPIYCKNSYQNIADAFLLFASHQEVKRIAYAASFGVDTWEYSTTETRICRELIQRFDAVSVREKSGTGLCANYLDYNKAKWVLDPTMLLDKEDYLVLINKANIPQSKANLFVYILDKTEEKESIINEILQETKFTSFECIRRLEKDKYIAEPVEKWLRAFLDAEMIVTDSFHACVFAILFRKPFLAIANKDRGMARFTSLLELFGLLDRLVYSYSDFQKKNSQLLTINYQLVDEILRKEREMSLSFLKNGLNI